MIHQRELKPIRTSNREWFQYAVQVGVHPAISHYAVSPAYYETASCARKEAQRYCSRRGIKWADNMIHVRKLNDGFPHKGLITDRER